MMNISTWLTNLANKIKTVNTNLTDTINEVDNKRKAVLLWTNSSPTTAFPEQSITIPSKYNYVIVATNDYYNSFACSITILKKGLGHTAMSFVGNIHGLMTVRFMQFKEDSTLYFDEGLCQNMDGSYYLYALEPYNKSCVPLVVYGLEEI